MMKDHINRGTHLARKLKTQTPRHILVIMRNVRRCSLLSVGLVKIVAADISPATSTPHGSP
jgi:hypothetical protein